MASVRAPDSSTVNIYQPAEPKKQIEIDLKSLKEWCGIKPDDIGKGDWGTDRKLPVVDANKALDGMDLEESKFEGNPPVEFTFESGIRLVVAVINRNAKLIKEDSEPYLPLWCSSAGARHLLRCLGNVETEYPRLIANPPQYGGRICSASSSDHKYWTGVILQMLYEQGHISSYGRKGGEYWVCL